MTTAFLQKGAYDMVRINTEEGAIRISGDVFTTLAGAAATSCFGVRGMAKKSASDGLVHLLKREAMGKGVRVSFHEEEGSISVELHIIVNTGVNIPVICDSSGAAVRYKLTQATGVKVRNVDVFVDSVMPE